MRYLLYFRYALCIHDLYNKYLIGIIRAFSGGPLTLAYALILRRSRGRLCHTGFVPDHHYLSTPSRSSLFSAGFLAWT